MTIRKKLIEVSIPLEAINAAAAREKSIRHGHPSTLHLWWARRPLAACRAVLFAQLVDDPSAWPERFTGEGVQEGERKRLHGSVIAQLVKWENSNNETVLNRARWEIMRARSAWGRGEEPPARDDGAAILAYLQAKAPPVYDPFCGGGSIPLEAQRLGLRAYGSDLNPVAVLISKALVEIPPKFAGQAAGASRPRPAQALSGRAWYGRGCALLRAVDARRGRAADRSSLPESVAGSAGVSPASGRDGRGPRGGAGSAGLRPACGRDGRTPTRGDGDRVVVGAHGALARSGGEGCHGAARLLLHALDKGGQEGVG